MSEGSRASSSSLYSVTRFTHTVYAKPCIYHNYLASDHDRVALIASVRLAMDLFPQSVKGAARALLDSGTRHGADIVAFIKQRIGRNYHPVCTCAIGHLDDSNRRVSGT